MSEKIKKIKVLCWTSCSDGKEIQLFRERLSEKVHATIPKGIVGGFEFTVLQRNLKELVRKAMEMSLWVLKKSYKSRFNSFSRQEQCIDHIPYYLSGLSRVHFFWQPFLKWLYTKKRDVRAKLLFCLCTHFAFLPFSFTSPSSLLS